MNNHIIELYLKHIINPLETIIKKPDFINKNSKEEQQTIDKLLLHHYRELESMMKDKIWNSKILLSYI